MKEKRIRYHMLLEFHSFLYNLANYETEFIKQKDFSEPDPFVKELIDKTYNDLSSIMRSDLQLLFKDTVLFSSAIVSPLITNKFINYREFRDEMLKMSADEYIRLFILSASELEVVGGSEEEKIEAFEEQLQNMDQGETIIESYRELKKYPEQTMDRIRNFMDRFYFEYFEKIEDQIENFLKQKLVKHQQLFDNDREKFISEIVKVSFDGMEGSDIDYEYYLGYMNISKLSYHKDENKVYCYYSYQFEKLFDPEFLDKQLVEFFKTLADETRLKMLRLLAERSYYSKELADELGLNKATVSYHMKMFNRFNVIDVTLGKNKRIYYSVNKKNLENFFSRFMNSL